MRIELGVIEDIVLDVLVRRLSLLAHIRILVKESCAWH